MGMVLHGCVDYSSLGTTFLTDYKSLKPVNDDNDMRLHVGLGVDWSDYAAVNLDPVQFLVAIGPSISPYAAHQLSHFFEAELRRALAEHYEINVVRPEGMIQVSTAITEIATSPTQGAQIRAEVNVIDLDGRDSLAKMVITRPANSTTVDDLRLALTRIAGDVSAVLR